MRVDVSSHTNFERAFEKCLETFGALDIVVNNAGVDGEINWEVQMQINLFVSTPMLKIRRHKFILKLGVSVRPLHLPIITLLFLNNTWA